MNLDDKALFLDAMEDVQPLKRHTDVHWQPTRNLKTPQRIDTLQLDKDVYKRQAGRNVPKNAVSFYPGGAERGVA